MNDNVQISEQRILEQVIKTLESAPEPLPLSKLQKKGSPYLLPAQARDIGADGLERVVERAVKQGQLHRFPPYGNAKGERFWTSDTTEYAKTIVADYVNSGLRTENEIHKRVTARIKGLSKDRVKTLVRHLAKSNAIRDYPPLPGGRTALYGAPHEFLDREYLRRSLEKALAKTGKLPHLTPDVIYRLATRGLNDLFPEHARSAAGQGDADAPTARTSPDDLDLDLDDDAGTGTGTTPATPTSSQTLQDTEGLVLTTMEQMTRERGMTQYVMIPDLRHRLGDRVARHILDETLLNLVERAILDVSSHDSPVHLTEQERSQLLSDRYGNVFNALLVRKPGTRGDQQ